MNTLAHRPLGKTGIHVSVVAWGTVKVGRNQGVKNRVPDGFLLPDDATVSRLLSVCRERGINLIDTAPAYGLSEERLGTLIDGTRASFVLSTKVGETFDGSESRYDFSAPAIRASVARSMQRLRTDYLDCVLLHLPREDEATLRGTDALATLARLKEEGTIRAFGASTHTVAGGIYALEHADVVMVPFNPTYTEHLAVIERAAVIGKGITIKRGLQSGHIDPTDPARAIRTCFEAAFRHPAVSSLVAGTIHPEHLTQNCALATEVLGDGKLKEKV